MTLPVPGAQIAPYTQNVNIPDFTQYNQGVGQATQGTNAWADALDRVQQKLDGITQRAGSKLLGIGAGIGAGFSGAAADAAAFQNQLTTLDATSKVVPLNMDRLKASINSTFTSLPVARGDIIAMDEALTTLGIRGAQNISRIGDTILKLRAATGEDQGALASGLIQFARLGGNVSPERIEGLANAALTVSRNAGVAVTGVLSFAQAIEPMARQAGIGEAAVLGISAAFSKAGADGYVAANTFNTIVSDITSLTQSGSPEIAKYANLIGVTSAQLKAMPKENVIERIFNVLGKQGPQAINTLNRLGFDGVRAQAALAAVIQSGQLDEQIRKAVRSQHDNTNLNRAAEAGFGGVVNTLKELRNELTHLGDVVGQPILGPLNLFLQTLVKAGHIAGQVLSPFRPLLEFVGALAAAFTSLGGATLLATGLLAKLAVAGFVGRSSPIQAFIAGRAAGLGRNLSPTQSIYAQRAEQGNLRFWQAPFYSAGQRMGTSSLEEQVRLQAINESRAAQGLPPIAPVGMVSRAAALPFKAGSWLVGGTTDFYRNAGRPGYERSGGLLGAMGSGASRVRSWFGGEPYVGAHRVAEPAPPGESGPRVFAVSTSGVAQEQALKANATAEERAAAAATKLAEAEVEETAARAKYTEATLAASKAVTGSAEQQARAQVGVTEAARNLAVAMVRLEGATIAAGTRTAGAAGLAGIRGALGSRFGAAFGTVLTGQIIGSLISDPNHPYGLRSQVGGAFSDAAIGAGIGTLALGPGLGTVVGGIGGALYGIINRPTPPTPVAPIPPIKAYQRKAAATGTDQASRKVLYDYLAKRGLTDDALKRAGMSKEQFVDDVLKGGEDRERALGQLAAVHLITPGSDQYYNAPKGELTTGDLDTAIKNFQAGTKSGVQSFGQVHSAVAGTGIVGQFTSVSPIINQYYRHPSDPRLQYQATQEQLRLAGGTPYEGLQSAEFGRSASGTILQLDKLTGAIKDTTDPLYQLARAARSAALQQLQYQQPYQSRLGQLRSAAGVYREAVRANEQFPTQDSAKDLDAARSAYQQQLASYHDYTIQVEQTAIQFGIQRSRMEEDYQRARYVSNRDFYIQLEQQQQDYQIQTARSQQDFQIQLHRELMSTTETTYSPFERIQAQFTIDAGTANQNIQQITQTIREQYHELQELRDMGISQETIDAMQLADPRNAQQVHNLYITLKAQPKLIGQLNRNVQREVGAYKQLTQSSFNESFRNTVADFERGLNRAEEDYNRARQRAIDAQDRALGDMAFNYNRQVERSAQDLTTAMTELFGTFSDSTEASLKAVIANIQKYAPAIAKTLEQQLSSARRVAQRAAGVSTVDVIGVNAAGQIGSYDASGKWHPYKGYINPTQAENLPRVYNPITGHAMGSISLKEHAALFSEGNRPEANIPLDQRGVNFMVGFANQVSMAMLRQMHGQTNPLSGLGKGGDSYHNEYDYSTNFDGQWRIEASDPEQLAKKLQELARLNRLTHPHGPRG